MAGPDAGAARASMELNLSRGAAPLGFAHPGVRRDCERGRRGDDTATRRDDTSTHRHATLDAHPDRTRVSVPHTPFCPHSRPALESGHESCSGCQPATHPGAHLVPDSLPSASANRLSGPA